MTQRNTGSTDHVSFDAVGVPGFQFVQDHAVEADLKQASAIVASFVYNAATRPQKLPRKPFVEN